MYTINGAFSRNGFTVEVKRNGSEKPNRTIICTDAGRVWSLVLREDGHEDMEYEMPQSMCNICYMWGAWICMDMDWDLLTMEMREYATHSVAKEGQK